MDKVVKQTARAKHPPRNTFVAYHRSLIHDKQRMFVIIVISLKVRYLCRECLLAIDFLMYRVGHMPSMQGKDLCRTSRRGQQHDRTMQGVQGLHQCSHKRSLTRSGIASKQKHLVPLRRCKEITPTPYNIELFGRCLVRKFRKDKVG